MRSGVSLLSTILVLGALAPARAARSADANQLEKGTIVGHVVVFGARTTARRVAQFYASALDAPPELVNESSMLERIVAGHAVFASGGVAPDAALGAMFVAWDDGSCERIEFGSRKLANGVPADAPAAGLVAQGSYLFATDHSAAGPALASYLDRTLAAERPRSRSERVDAAGHLEIASGRALWIPRFLALARLSAALLVRDEAMRARVASATDAVERAVADVETVDLRIGFDADALRIESRVEMRGDSKIAAALGRARSIAPAPPPGSTDSLAETVASGEFGVDLATAFSLIARADARSPPRVAEDLDIEDSRVVLRTKDGRPAVLLAGTWTEDSSPPTESALATLGASSARDGRRLAIGFGDDAPQRLLSLLAQESPRSAGIAMPDRIGFVRFSAPGLLRLLVPAAVPSSGRRSDSLLSTATIERQGSAVACRFLIPRAEWSDLVPKLEFH